jgi:hypothetical protein
LTPLYSFHKFCFILFKLCFSSETSDMDRKDTGERDASKDKSPTPGITPKGSEGAMDVRGGAAGSGGGSRQRYNSEDAASSEGISDQGKRYI